MVYVHNLDPVLFHLGPLEIRYYGLAYVLGLTLAYFILRKLIKERQFPMSDDDLLDFMIYVAFGVLLGSRIFYFIFYQFSTLVVRPWELLMIWHGGMSFHGGLIGVACAVLLFSHRRGHHWLALGDMLVIPTILALAIGRIANFINGELYGRVTTVPWAVDFGDGLARHPSQLYESAKGFFTFGVLWFLRNKKWKQGTLFALFLLLYGTLRFFIEFVREPDSQLGFVLFGIFSMGQVLCFVMVLFGLGLLWYIHRK